MKMNARFQSAEVRVVPNSEQTKQQFGRQHLIDPQDEVANVTQDLNPQLDERQEIHAFQLTNTPKDAYYQDEQMVLNSLLQEQDREAETRPLKNKIKVLQLQKRTQNKRLHTVHEQVKELKREMEDLRVCQNTYPDCSDLVIKLTNAIQKQNA